MILWTIDVTLADANRVALAVGREAQRLPVAGYALTAEDWLLVNAATANHHPMVIAARAVHATVLLWVPLATEVAQAVATAQAVGARDVLAAHDDPNVWALRLAQVQPRAPREPVRQPRKSDVIIGSGAWHKELFDRIAAMAAADAAVAIWGESGTGKELVARTIHRSSARRDGPFVVVNCAAIPAALLEDELFGHVRGAFTDANRDREGLIAAAHGGSLFLDEIGELPMSMQAKLLRFLQSHEIRRIGDDVDRFVDVRVITATHRDLPRAIAAGEFRQDLYYRIAVLALQLPPLRARKEDIPLLVHHIVSRLRTRLGVRVTGASPEALRALVAYDWPGNVRELENRIHHAMVVATEPWFSEADLGLPQAVRKPATARMDVQRPFRELKSEIVADFERAYILALLEAAGGNVAEAARLAKIDRKNIWALMKRYGVARSSLAAPTARAPRLAADRET